MEPGQSGALEAGREYFTQKLIVPGVEDHCLVEMQHVIVRIRRAVIHGEGRYREAAGRFVIQDMLTEGRGEHVLWPPDGRGENMCGAGATLKGGYMDGTCGVTLPGRLGTYSRAGSDWRQSLLASLC